METDALYANIYCIYSQLCDVIEEVSPWVKKLTFLFRKKCHLVVKLYTLSLNRPKGE